ESSERRCEWFSDLRSGAGGWSAACPAFWRGVSGNYYSDVASHLFFLSVPHLSWNSHSAGRAVYTGVPYPCGAAAYPGILFPEYHYLEAPECAGLLYRRN